MSLYIKDLKFSALQDWKLVVKFWSLVDKSKGFGPWGDCWRWTGIDSSGRGRFLVKYKLHFAARVSYVLAFKIDLLNGIRVLHKCDNIQCVRPGHLFIGSQKKNMRDASRKGRLIWKPSHRFRRDIKYLKATRPHGDKHWHRTHPELIPKGEAVNTAQVTEEQVRRIRKLCARKKLTHKQIAKKFGVSAHLVSRIHQRETWKWLK